MQQQEAVAARGEAAAVEDAAAGRQQVQALSAQVQPAPGHAEGEVSTQVRGVVDLLARRHARLERGGGAEGEDKAGGAL